ncbi:MAG TPA: hypothetical protein VMP67_06480 [Candidatus Limnocylindria bacterium]|nr:hypothetical protein [Candidatus Limnocylindria bacterium]
MTQIVLEISGRSILLPNVAVCLVTDAQVEISASDASRTAGLTVSWRADQPPEQTRITWIDPGSGGTLVTGPDVSTDSPPAVIVSGHSVEIVTEAHDPVTGRPSQSMRILADCPDTPRDEPAAPTQPPAGPSGSASFTTNGREYTFEFGELCEISSGSATAVLTDAEGNSFDLIVMGQTGFFTVTIGSGEQWTAGYTGEPVQPTISGSSATWSGTAFETYSQREADASLSVECAR